MTTRDSNSSDRLSSLLTALRGEYQAKRNQQLEWHAEAEAAHDGANAHTFLARANVYQDIIAALDPLILQAQTLEAENALLKRKYLTLMYAGDETKEVARIASTRDVSAPDATAGQVDVLRAFARKVLRGYLCDGDEIGDIDGGDLQEWAEDNGLLQAVEVTEPCGEFCGCADGGDFPSWCFRPTKLLSPSAGEAKGSDVVPTQPDAETRTADFASGYSSGITDVRAYDQREEE